MPRLPSPAAVVSMVIAVFVALMVGAPVGAHAQTTSRAAPAKRVAPPGYTRRFSASKSAAPGVATRAMVRCPKGTVPLSGGAFVPDEDLLVNLIDSFPSGSAWVVDIGNADGVARDFQVTAVCARKPSHYKVMRAHPEALGPNTGSSFFVTCPVGSKPLGGGVTVAPTLQSPGTTTLGMTATFPDGRDWQITYDNSGTTDVGVTAVALCGSVPRYRAIKGTPIDVPAQSQGTLHASCPAPTVLLGGGVFSHVLIGDAVAWSTMGEAFDWFSAINNPSDASTSAAGVAICGT